MNHQKETQDEPIHKGKITVCSPQQASDSTVQDQRTLYNDCETKTRCVTASLGAQMMESQCSVAPVTIEIANHRRLTAQLYTDLWKDFSPVIVYPTIEGSDD